MLFTFQLVSTANGADQWNNKYRNLLNKCTSLNECALDFLTLPCHISNITKPIAIKFSRPNSKVLRISHS